MKTLKEFNEKATGIVEHYFTDMGAKINPTSTGALIAGHVKDQIHFSVGYFIQLNNGKNIFGNVHGKSFDEAIENLNAKCEFDKATILSGVNNKPDIDIVIGC